MKKLQLLLFVFLLSGLVLPGTAQEVSVSPGQRAEAIEVENKSVEKTKLNILWTTSDKGVFEKVVYPYAFNSKKYEWWQNVTLIIWGPSAKTAVNDLEIRAQIKQLKEAGVNLTACKWCSDSYNVSDKLIELGVDVKYMGKPLTEMLKSDNETVITF